MQRKFVQCKDRRNGQRWELNCITASLSEFGKAANRSMCIDIGLVGDQYYEIITVFYVPLCLCGTPLSIREPNTAWSPFTKCLTNDGADTLNSREKVLRCKSDPSYDAWIRRMFFMHCCSEEFWRVDVSENPLGSFREPIVSHCPSLYLTTSPSICATLIQHHIRLPSVVFYLSQFYTRGELARRIGVFYAASAISGAFSGLLAFGIFQIKSTKLYSWQYLFVSLSLWKWDMWS